MIKLHFRHSLLCAFLLVLLAAPAQAAPAKSDLAAAPALARLGGVWKADIDATLVRMTSWRTAPMRDYEMEDLKETLAALELSIEPGPMRVTEKGPGGSEVSFAIESLELEGDTLRIHGDRRRYSITMQEDGSIVIGSGVVMRREE